MKKLTKLFSAIAILSVLALFGCSNPNNTSTDNSTTDNPTTDNPTTDNSTTDNSTTDNSITDNSINLDGYYTITSLILPSPIDGPTTDTNKDSSIYVMKNNTIYFFGSSGKPKIKFILQADKTIKAYIDQYNSGEDTLELSGNWNQTNDKLVLTASRFPFSYEYTLAKNNDISWPTESDFAKLDGTYSHPQDKEIIIKDGKFNFYGTMPVVLKADGTLTFTYGDKEYSGYWFMKDAKTLAISVSKLRYEEFTKQ